MRNSLFKKAKKYLEKISLETDNDEKQIFKVRGNTGDYSVIFEYRDHTLKHHCDCFHMAAKQPTNLCSHKMACIAWKVNNGK